MNDVQAFKLTPEELARIDRCFPDIERDKEPRYYTCDCAEAYRAVRGILPPTRKDKPGHNESFVVTRITATSDGICPHCGYYATLMRAGSLLSINPSRKRNARKVGT